MKPLCTTAVFIVVLLANPALAQNAGTLDASFGMNGVVEDTCCHAYVPIMDLAVRADGKITVGGAYWLSGGRVVRYNSDGSRDATFGDNGLVVLDSIMYITKVLPMANGKTLVAGYQSGSTTGHDAVVIRINENGSLDTAFGPHNSGVSRKHFLGVSDQLYDIAELPNGKIMTLGVTTSPPPLITGYVLTWRLNADGTTDTTYSNNPQFANDEGWDTIRMPGFNLMTAQGLATLPDGRMLATGFIESAGGSLTGYFYLLRIQQDGRPDSTFGTNGAAWFNPGDYFSIGADLLVQPDGKIVVAGTAANAATSRDGLVARFNADGTPDVGFNGGFVMIDAGAFDDLYRVKLQADGKIVVAGSASPAISVSSFFLARLNPDGSPDATFGNNGVVLHSLGMANQNAYGLDLQPDGKIVAAGYLTEGPSLADRLVTMRFHDVAVGVDPVYNIAVIELFPNPSNGLLRLSIQNENSPLYAEVVDLHGRIILTEHWSEGNELELALPCALPDGLYLVRVISRQGVSTRPFLLSR